MLVRFLEDLKNTVSIAKAVSGFGMLVDWHEPNNLLEWLPKFISTMRPRSRTLSKLMLAFLKEVTPGQCLCMF